MAASVKDVTEFDNEREVEPEPIPPPQTKRVELGKFIKLDSTQPTATQTKRPKLEDDAIREKLKLSVIEYKFFTSLNKVSGHITNESKFVPGTILKTPDDIWFNGNEDIKSEIFIRESYVALAESILDNFEAGNERGTILGGTPGIGKSVFLTFLLCCCYLRRELKPKKYDVIFFRLPETEGICLRWTDAGYVCESAPFKQQIGKLYLFDMDDKTSAAAHSHSYVVAACSPSSNFKELAKRPIIYRFMPVWSKEELLAYRKLSTLYRSMRKCDIRANYKILGGTARKVLKQGKITDDTDMEIKQYLATGYKRCPIEKVFNAVEHGWGSADLSHRLIHMAVTNDYREYTFVFASLEIKSKFMIQKMTLEADQVLNYAANLRESGAQSMRGILFEILAHSLFYSSDEFCLRVKRLYRKSTSVPDVTEKSFRALEVGNVHGNHIGELRARHYGIGVKNLCAIDGVLQPSSVFQMTVSRQHTIKMTGLVNALRQMEGDEKERVDFYFLVPQDVFDDFEYQRLVFTPPTANQKFLKKNESKLSCEEYISNRRMRMWVASVDLSSQDVKARVTAAYTQHRESLCKWLYSL